MVSTELDSTLRDIHVDPSRFFDFAISFPGCMEFFTLDSLLNCCLVSVACGGWFGHEVFLDVVSRRKVTDFSTSVSSPNVLACRQKRKRHSHCHLLKMSVNIASTIFGFASWVI